MANRELSADEIERLFKPLIDDIRKSIAALSKGDKALLWALRRKLTKELTYDERGKPMLRRKPKDQKRAEQDNKCAGCGCSLSVKYAVLDRKEDMKGYTAQNTRLLCVSCDSKIQIERGLNSLRARA